MLARACSGEPAQRWKGLATEAAEEVARGIADPLVRRVFLRTVAAGRAGSLVSLANGRPLQAVVATATCGVVVNLGGGTVLRLDGKS